MQHRQGWYPPGLRWWSLTAALLCCWTFVAIIQYYLHQSQTQGGILFAAKINDLPLHHSFWHLYLPTIIAVIFSIFIVWIDHDAKRYEPYRHLSRSDGALAKNSILLHYPFDFAPIVPIVAAKRR
jgi:C4-dicarboxylate transporter